MDDDELRRGRPTLHMVYGEGMAILAGDGLHAEAFGLLAREPRTADAALDARKLRVIGLVAEAAGCAGMVGGQAIDLDAVGTKTKRQSKAARRQRSSRDARPEDRSLDSRIGGRRRRHGRRRRSSCSAHSTATRRKSDSPFRSWTTFSTSKGRRSPSARPREKTRRLASRPIHRSTALEQSRRLATECLTRAAARARRSRPRRFEAGRHRPLDRRSEKLTKVPMGASRPRAKADA